MSQRFSTSSSRRSSIADLSNAVSKPPILRPTTRTKKQRTDPPVPRTPVCSVYPHKPIEVDDSPPQIDSAFREATGSRTPAPVKATGNKRPTIRPPRITVRNAGNTPVDTRKQRKVLDTPEERRRGEAIIGSATLSVSGLDPEEDEFTSETLTRDVEYQPGEEEEYYGAEKNGAVSMCVNPDDSASIYGRVVQCERGDLCCGSQFYHQECPNNQRLPHPQEDEEVLSDYFAQYNFVCPPCLEDLPEDAETDGKITATMHPNVGKKRGLRRAPYDHENGKWRTDFAMKTGEGDMEEDRPPQHMRDWEKDLIMKQAVFVVITNLEPHYAQCAKALRKEHGIHKTWDGLEDPKALLRQAAFPRIDQPNYLIYAGPNLRELEIIVASFGPKPKDKPEDKEITFDHLNEDKRSMMSRYTVGLDNFGPIARLKQQEAARRAHCSLATSEHATLDNIRDAIVADIPTTPATSSPQTPRPTLQANVTPSTTQLLKYQHVVPFPESAADQVLR
ncbi:uncharacterized protein EV422DRAFT_569215 [Fimicolochytrium jonesii]|uniref:uncharacterized protein n=1 Tax=Fimicolochytrium jonesii TaxID=1396493 RepID=UPI0022FEA029|nr:uncharacterized protein EV422DRAFT_569215 [Fimicolochytrium jonesii]KAI8818945.1 hypothetical protein EV422DRAFT_569215 [Fimicolochytrium jonesii]